MSNNLTGGGYHWQTPEHVDRWGERTPAFTAERKVGFVRMLEQLPADAETPLRIVDLGAGDGRVAAVVLETYPRAEAVLVDFSSAMMARGVELLHRFEPRYRYLHWDMNAGDWPHELAGPFDAVVSSAAIHHLANERKQWLLSTAVFARLAPDGVFANYDLFRNPDAVFADAEVHDRTCSTLDETRQFLMVAGFQDVAVAAQSARPAHQGELALIVGRKPLEGDRPCGD